MWEVSKRNFCVRKSNGDGPEAAWGYRSVSWSLALGKFRFSCFVLLLAHVNAVFLFCFSTCCGPSAVSASVVSEPMPVHKNVNLRGYLMSTSDGAGGCWSLIAVEGGGLTVKTMFASGSSACLTSDPETRINLHLTFIISPNPILKSVSFVVVVSVIIISSSLHETANNSLYSTWN